MVEELIASVTHNPSTLSKIYRTEFIDKMNARAVNYYPTEDPYTYNFKRRFKSARRIPAPFVKKDDENGYIVLSADFKRRYWKDNRTRYHYLVYKTIRGYWICTCSDFAFHIPKPCKHIIRVILYERGFNNDDNTKLSRRMALIFEDKNKELSSIIKYS